MGDFLLLIFPLSAILLAVIYRKVYWKISLLILLLCVPVILITLHESNTCSGYLCGLGEDVGGFIVVAVLVVISIALALIPKRNTKLLVAIFLLPVLIYVILGAWTYYNDNRSGALNPYTNECKREGFDGAKGDSCTCNNTSPISACCKIPGTVCGGTTESRRNTLSNLSTNS